MLNSTIFHGKKQIYILIFVEVAVGAALAAGTGACLSL